MFSSYWKSHSMNSVAAHSIHSHSYAFMLMRTRVLTALSSLNTKRLQSILFRFGPIYAFFALAFGGFYRNPLDLVVLVVRVIHTLTHTLALYIARGRKPLHPGWTLRFELLRAVINCLMSQYGDRLGSVRNAKFSRTQSALAGTAFGYLICRQHSTRIESVRHNGLEHIWLRDKDPRPTASGRQRFVVLYFHGGGMMVGSPRMYIAFGTEFRAHIRRQLIQLVGNNADLAVDVLLANYRKVPEYAYPIPPQDALTMYEYLIHSLNIAPHQIILAGDSAGGALVLTTLLRLRDQSMSHLFPLGGVLSCPMTDLEVCGDERVTPHCLLADKVGKTIYSLYHPRTGDPTTWGDASPMHCNLSALPPVFIQAAELDYLFSHSQRLMEKAKKDGVTNWELDVQPSVPHVFTNFPASILPQAEEGLRVMATFVAKRFVEGMKIAEKA